MKLKMSKSRYKVFQEVYKKGNNKFLLAERVEYKRGVWSLFWVALQEDTNATLLLDGGTAAVIRHCCCIYTHVIHIHIDKTHSFILKSDRKKERELYFSLNFNHVLTQNAV